MKAGVYAFVLVSLLMATTSTGALARPVTGCQVVELYPGYPGYRGNITGMNGAGDVACLEQLEADDPMFDRAREDRLNRQAAQQLGIIGSFDNWTWELWMLVEGQRGLAVHCYVCLLFDQTLTPVAPFAAASRVSPYDPRIRAGSVLAPIALPDLRLTYGGLTAFTNDYQLRAFAFLTELGYPTANGLVAAYERLAQQWTAGQWYDSVEMINATLDRGGYVPAPPGANPLDQKFLIEMVLVALQPVYPAPIWNALHSRFLQLFDEWQSATLRGESTPSLAAYIRANNLV